MITTEIGISALIRGTGRPPLAAPTGRLGADGRVRWTSPTLKGTSTVWDIELTTIGSASALIDVLALERPGYTIARQTLVDRTVVCNLARETP